MKDGNWSEIIDHYKKARDCFWGPKGVHTWHRDDENGYYHLWTAYHLAQESEEKDHLWYARILYMMLSEHRSIFSDYYVDHDALYKFAIPMMKEFALATEEGNPPTEKELKIGKDRYEMLLYDEQCTSYETNSIEKSFQLIENSELLENFYYTDSVPILFQYTQTSAILKLKNDQMVATLEFTGLYEIHVDCDPSCNWIEDFFCYPARKGDSRQIVFDIEYYKITCEHIKVLSVEKTDETV